MKTITFFRRTYTVPGGSKVNPESGPLRLAMVSRVVYCLYPEDKAVVYSGIDRGMPTKVATRMIIELIAKAEKLDVEEWSFLDLVTSMHNDEIEPGYCEFHLMSWRLDDGKIVVEGSALLDCPPEVRHDFHHYIHSASYAHEVERLSWSNSDDDEDEDGEGDDEPSRPKPPAPGSTN